MSDMGEALAAETPPIMLGGGNPALLEEMQAIFRARLQVLAQDAECLERTIAVYDGPRGDSVFIGDGQVTEGLFWLAIGPDNIAVTTVHKALSSTCSVCSAVNIRTVRCDASSSAIAEYIGYADQGLIPDLFVAQRRASNCWTVACSSTALTWTTSTCRTMPSIVVSRPTNPMATW